VVEVPDIGYEPANNRPGRETRPGRLTRRFHRSARASPRARFYSFSR
jgi:hypothetical protein